MTKYENGVASWYGKDLTETFINYPVIFSKVESKKILDKYIAEGYINEPDDIVFFNAMEIEDMIRENPETEKAVDWENGEFDEFLRDEVLSELIKDGEAYLVYASGVRWNGADGYKVVENIEDAFYRGYDASIRVDAGSAGGKILRCIESSHDVPMGSYTYIIALTADEEYDIENMSFDAVRHFVERCAARIIEPPEKKNAA